MLTLFLSIIFYFSLNAILVYFSKQKFESVIPFSFIISAFILYCFGFLKNLRLGFYAILVAIVVFYLFLIINKNNRKDFYKNYFTIGFTIFLFIFVFIYLLQITRSVNFWDEFGHWGPMVKESYRLNNFYSISTSRLQRHKDYPPFYTLIEIIWCFLNREYTEGIIYVGYTIFTISLFMPLLSKYDAKEKKDWIKAILVSLGFLLILITIDYTDNQSDTAHFFNSFYMDWSMAIFVAFTIFHIIFDKNSPISNVKYCLCFMSLLLMKQMGGPFYLLCLLLLIIRLIVFDKEKNIKKIYSMLLFSVAIPLLFYLSWKVLIGYLGVSEYAQFKISSIKINNLFNIAKGTGGLDWQKEAFDNFVYAINNRILITHPFRMNYISYVLFISFFILMSFDNKKEGVAVTAVYLFGSIAYAFAMILLYVFAFGDFEGPQLASFNRYLITYLFIGTALSYMLWSNKAKSFNIGYIVLILFFVSFFVEPKDIQELKIVQLRNGKFGDSPQAYITRNSEPTSKNKILIIKQKIESVEYDAICAYLEGENINTIKIGPPEYDSDKTEYMSFSDLRNKLKDYDYLYVYNNNQHSQDYWKEIIGKEIDDRTLLRIVNCGGTLSFLTIGS